MHELDCTQGCIIIAVFVQFAGLLFYPATAGFNSLTSGLLSVTGGASLRCQHMLTWPLLNAVAAIVPI